MKAKGGVRGTVWSLSHHSAGECISFVTNAKKIEARYIVAGGKFMWHMPATGVAGVDQYTKNNDYDNAICELELLKEYSSDSYHILGFNLHNVL